MMPLLLLLLLPVGTPASELYFPQSDLTVRIPYFPRSDGRFSRTLKLLELRTFRNDSTEPNRAKYRVTVPRESIVSIESETNSLLLHGPPKLQGTSGHAAILVMAKEDAGNEAALEIKVKPLRTNGTRINCTEFVQDMCFWNASRYRIYENQPAAMIGTFGPDVYREICPDFRVIEYNLLNGTEYLYVSNDTLYANASLDRDSFGPAPGGPGPKLSVKVRCVIWEETTGIQYAPISVLHVDVLDQDDNPPTAQGNTSLEITLGEFTAGATLVDESKLILKDVDAESSNRYTIRTLGDIHDALKVEYSTLPIEDFKGHTTPPYTAIFTKISAKTTLLPKSPYRVTLRVKDESLVPGHGEDTLNITLTLYGPEHRTTTTTLPPVSLNKQQLFSYPSSVKVARLAARFSRVAKPSTEPYPSTTFSLNGSSAFAVTSKGGIVYVADEDLLKTEPLNLTLKLKWSGRDVEKISSKTIRINLSSVSATKTDACAQTKNARAHSCAIAETPEECESSCGVASGVYSKGNYSGQCAWRWKKRSNEVSVMSDHYPTCSPDLSHCPDNQCDDLEQLDPRICPQDCIVEPNAHFAEMNENGRGIKSSSGTCVCSDELQCTCNVDSFRIADDDAGKAGKAGRGAKEAREGKSRDEEKENLIAGARKAAHGPCGPFCMTGVIGGSFFVLIAIAGSLVTSRYRLAAKEARREGKRRVDGDSNGVGILPSDYIDRGDGLLIGLDTFTAANRHLLLPKACPPDPKWEFARARLTIEQVLGEGEFGRVLRAKAIDIAGIPGPTTVAVKTLKENACASELADLLSEYQLLKEAQHPNVIRLLGACTTPGAPVYLIIEFAEFGSLRNYLRRSRHLESEGRVGGCSLLLDAVVGDAEGMSCNAYTVTPRDILSFAWQISKGMAYLADIKLVHRDLAARNVLLATEKVCKISDFGLTRDVYEDDAYLKRSKGRVPVKWMAPESLADHVYTSKSDVWSFGVLLWELVTLGASPYPGIDVHNLYNLLKAGYRMERPANCSQQLYKLMMSCWHQEPAIRPSFRELTSHWEKMLEDSVEYLDLNPRTVHNQAYFASLHALDSPCSSGNDASGGDAEIGAFRTDVVNYLEKPSSDTVTKCDKIDKLHTLWQEPIASFPGEAVKLYVNDLGDRSPGFRVNHYESPIKFRNTSVTSNSENDLVTPTNQRSQSYIDMQGKKSSEAEAEAETEAEAEAETETEAEAEELLVFGNATDKDRAN